MPDKAAPYIDPQLQAEAIKAFVATHARPYDAANDDYDRPAFAADIKEGKGDRIYAAHTYHTKVPPRSIVPYILHYTDPNDLVLDLFCGSGMTGVAAHMCANPPQDLIEQFPELRDRVGPRACVLNDLSPAACHIAYNYNTPVDVEAMKQEFQRIASAVQAEIDWLYGTEHYEPAVGRYDPHNAAVASRLKNPPGGATMRSLLGGEDKNWELLSKADVESRLGYPVTELPRNGETPSQNPEDIQDWICIPATIQYTVWSDTYRCEGLVTVSEPTGKTSVRGKNAGKPMVKKRRVARGCGGTFDLWSTALDRSTGAVAEVFRCPHCPLEWKKTQLKKQPQIAVWCCYEYTGITAAGETKVARGERPVTAREKDRVRECAVERNPHWAPDVRWDKKWPQYRRNALAGRGIQTLADFYTSRNIRALGSIIEQIRQCKDRRIEAALTFCFTSIFRFVDKRAVYAPPALKAISGTLYFPSLSVEHNVWRFFASKVPASIKAFPSRDNPSAIGVICGSATHLNSVADSSIDYIFTDPPFGSNIYYSEMNLLWEGWLGTLTDMTEEAVVHRKNDGGTKRLEDYRRLMSEAFREMYRVLKPGRWCTVEFNNSDGSVFEAVKQGVREAGFEIVNMLLLDKAQKSFKQLKGAEGIEDVVDKDVLFNLHKPAIASTNRRDDDHDLEPQVVEAVRLHLSTLPERIKADPAKYNDEHRTTATINSMLMNSLIPRGVSVERLNLPFIERVCARYFRKIGQHWYLRGESVGSGNGNALITQEVDVNDERTAIAWLRQKVQQRPMLIGELKPLWMRATGLLPASVSRELVLDMLLSENFWRDPDTNRWREPTEEEREKMNDDRSIRVLHDAERYVSETLHRMTTDAERCEWIDVLFKACRQVEDGDMQSVPALRGFSADEGYRLIARLFQNILREKVPADVFSRAQKQAGAASNRISQGIRDEDELRKTQAVKGKGPTLFDEVN